ncbi:MAG: MltA domain-containing protein, partial [Rhodospirillales bacterium]|nr:MltA domain-containing protein [Rhodospirillales bacterium]
KDLIASDLGSFDDKWQGERIAGRIDDSRYVPYYSRAEIEQGALRGRQLEIVWVDNAIDSFFLHIQGSGRVTLPDGTHVRIGYAGRNGRRYTAVGRELVAAGVMPLEDVTMPAIRAWMEENPVAAQALMLKNKSFVFFRVIKGDGPIGAQGVVLTPRRSIAVDRKYWPLGAPVWMDTTDPGTRPAMPLRRLGVAQDTGSAIKGAVRADYFWGHGNAAGSKAGTMKGRGRLYMLLPRTAVTNPPS